MALPREAHEARKFKGLRQGLGDTCLIAFQYVSEPTPKPFWPLDYTEGRGPAFESRLVRRFPDIRVRGMSATARSSREGEHGCERYSTTSASLAARDTTGATVARLLTAHGVAS
jgi:hypothetical protein